MQIRQQALREGRDATLAALRGEPAPRNPYRENTKRHRWWYDGAERATRLVSKIMEIGQ